jgi:hypothetical protein
MTDIPFSFIQALIEKIGVGGASVVVFGGLLWKSMSMVQGASNVLWPKINKAFLDFETIANSVQKLSTNLEKIESDQSSVIDLTSKTLDNTAEILKRMNRREEK